MSRTGHCLCGAVRYELRGELGPPVACHCSYCRRAHGSPFAVVSMVKRADFQITAGEDEVRSWETPGGGQRVFCGRCATRLGNLPKKFPTHMSLVVATLDTEMDQPPVAHVNVESKAPWYEIADGGPQFDALPPGAAEALDNSVS